MKTLNSNTPLLSAAQSDAVAELTHKLLETQAGKDKNAVASGISAWMALAVLYGGSGGTSSESLESLLGAGDDDLAAAWVSLAAKMSEAVGLTHATAVWSKVALLPSFIESFQEHVRFSSDLDQRALDAWTNNATGGLIQKFPLKIKDSTLLALADALSVRARWSEEFSKDATESQTFFTENNKKAKCDFMNAEFSANSVTRTESYVAWTTGAVGKEGRDDTSYSVQFVMPSERGTKTEAIATSLRPLGWTDRAGNARIQLPKFTVEEESDLLDVITTSVASVITTDNADFSGLSPTRLKVSSAAQRAVLKVDEEGFEAAAVTAIGMDIGGMPSQPALVDHVVFDHPFAVTVLLRDLPLFTAWIANPAN